MKHTIQSLFAVVMAITCSAENYKTIGSLESHDPQFDKLVSPDAKIEIIAEGFSWIEGPLWLPTENCLIFSNIPPNKIWKWTEKEGATVYLEKSGYLGKVPRPGVTGAFDQAGSNGLILSPLNQLVLCQHGLRQIGMMKAPLNDPKPNYIPLTDQNDEEQRYNSPNDGCYHRDGSLFFTDPPYGLPKGADDPTRETDYSGVYRLAKNGKVTLIDDQLERPNGIALSPTNDTLYVANSHGPNAIWMAYDLNEDGTVKSKRVFRDVTKMVGTRKGMPDGLKVNDAGYIFATAPGGVWVLDPKGKHLGTIVTKEFASNVAFGPEQKTLYITADMLLLRVKLK
ncbi:MAG: SMP-30/gluconolactonase/LRE family protein [Akkermansiaceae bacterium]